MYDMTCERHLNNFILGTDGAVIGKGEESRTSGLPCIALPGSVQEHVPLPKSSLMVRALRPAAKLAMSAPSTLTLAKSAAKCSLDMALFTA